jgi:hypothetical protein
LTAEVPRKNGWQIAERSGDATPDRTQRLLNHAVWDEHEAMGWPGSSPSTWTRLATRVRWWR